jgi:hypothetical protein
MIDRPLAYILDEDHRPVALPNDDWGPAWGRWMQKNDRHVGYTELADGIVYVSTVFLGIDHNHWGKGPPILFETMVFGLTMEDGDMQWRYSSWDDAETGHKATVKKVKAQLAKIKTPKLTAKKTTE